ncbi:hypothetical protein AMAG_20778 [Allomyces macrogynus ATCC 38327]|uniref:ubiquitinyl hydrolase 1 n=1 Tax=Allomyces macrogynus (strain ATCC 38327) TaxID=578462 RepID=A0A0L0TEX2_ALLM3|nr:hypothetical protein AMAG_20778 [Allomyces macrogynus ATCC 38327]|eukprot:KNE73398.1 hypothetical protein AMAG_20778 [Allomyces macrogynus ATCC 38327]
MSDVESNDPPTATTEAVADEEPCAPLDDRAFHYTAFIPYDGHVWELDGLLPRPKYIGPIREGETWHSVVMEHIDLRMEQYDPDDQRCNVMSLEVDPLLKSNATMAEIEQRIAAMRNGTALSVPSPPPVLATTASAEPAAKRARKGQHGATAEPMDVDVPTQGQQGNPPASAVPEPAVASASASCAAAVLQPEPEPQPEAEQELTTLGRSKRTAAVRRPRSGKAPTPDPVPPPLPLPPPTVDELEEQLRQMKVANDSALAERQTAMLEIERARVNYIPFIGTVWEKLYEVNPADARALVRRFT